MFKLFISQLGTNFEAWAESTGQSGIEIFRVEAAKAYLLCVERIRSLVIVFYWTLFCTILSALGLVMIGSSGLFYLQSERSLALQILCLGTGLFVIPLIILMSINSQRAWLRFCGILGFIKEAENRKINKAKF